jgi:tRNA (cytidine/uridine-2'-O-)-methyltransferase
MIKVALFEPDIAGNVGTIIRTCVGFDVELHIIEPCGFPFDINRIKKSALDYVFKAKIIRHQNFESFYNQELFSKDSRLVLASTKASINYLNFKFNKNDILMFGSESAGVPDEVYKRSHQRIFIPMKNNLRCFNVAISCGIILAKGIADTDF